MGRGWLTPTEDGPAVGAEEIDLKSLSEQQRAALAPVGIQDELMAKIVIGAESLAQDPAVRTSISTSLAPPKEELRNGSIDQRCAGAILEAFGGDREAAGVGVAGAKELALGLEEPFQGPALARVDATEVAISGRELTDSEWANLESLGYFQSVARALAPEQGSAADELRSGGVRAILLLFSFFGIVLIAGLIGLVLLVVVAVKSMSGPLPEPAGSLRARIAAAEVFAIYLFSAGALNLLAIWTFRNEGGEETDIGTVEVDESMGWTGLALQMALMAVPLLALAWPRRSGIPWVDMRQAIGLHRGRGVIREASSGVAIYCMMLPLVGCGLIAYLILSSLLGGGETPPSHPIVDEIRAGGFSVVLIMVLATVAAPIIEEIFFRGAFFPSLRARWSGLGQRGALIASAMVSSYLFAAIHPQGILFAPVLMGTALALCIGRVWRGSLIGPMVAHGLNNGLVVLLNVAIWS